MEEKENTIIAGGGVIGLTCAYFLAKAGHEVIVVDRDPTHRESCSEENAGLVVPSHFVPLAAPGVIAQGIRWMFSRRSPFFLRPRLDPELWRWVWHFYRHSNRAHVENTQELLRDLSLESRELFEDLADELDFELVTKGLLTLCETALGLHEESEVARVANRIGIQAEVCTPRRIRELEKEVEVRAVGGVWYPQDAHLNPAQFLEALRKGIQDRGGAFRTGEIAGFETENGVVRRVTFSDGEELGAGQLIIAGGSWSPEIAGLLGARLSLQAGKGYSFTLKKAAPLPGRSSLLIERRVAVTPMGEDLRIAGTMEICGKDLSVDPVRSDAIVDSFCDFFPQFSAEQFSEVEPWSGLRPCTPDGLPYIGRLPGLSNVVIATGHAMLGLSLGPVTARIVAGLLEEDEVDSRLLPSRF